MADFPIPVGAGSASITGAAPVLSNGNQLSVGAGGIVASGLAPVTSTSNPVPSTGAVRITGQPPVTSIGASSANKLPLLVVAGGILSEQLYTSALTLPKITLTADMAGGRTIQGAMSLPIPVVQSEINASDFALPMLTMDGVLDVGTKLVGVLSLPALTITGTLIPDQPYSGVFGLPVLSAAGVILAGGVQTSALLVPQLVVQANAVGGVSGAFLLSIPMFTVDGQAYAQYVGDYDLFLPALQVQAGMQVVGLPGVVKAGVAYALNVQNAALTQYANYDFNSFAKASGLTLGANATGIYLLSGDKDNGVNIDANFRFGRLDFGTALYKRVISAYIGYKASDDMVLTIGVDNTQYKYRLPALHKTEVHTNKVNLAKGARSRYWQFGMNNTNGGDFDIDTIETIPVILTRRIG